MANSKGNNIGRPSKYKKRFCKDIVIWAKEGTLPRQWSMKIGVCRTRLNDWTYKYPEFQEAWFLAKDIAEGIWLEKMIEAKNTMELTKATKILNMAFHMAEVQKIESKQEIDQNSKTTVSVSFGDRPE